MSESLRVPSPDRELPSRFNPRNPPHNAPDADAALATPIKGDDIGASSLTTSLTVRTRPASGKAVEARSVVSQSPFFEVLTPDLRYYIYQLAFGRKIIHLYLLYRRSLQPDLRWRKGHQPVPAWYPHSPGVSPMDPPFTDTSVTPQWYWWNCVCGPEDRRLESKLSDQCPRGFFQTCGPWETYLGILPWLLSCRQAYEETIKVLYASNTFKFEQRLEAMYFPYAIAMPQLKWITSLEFRIPDRDESLVDRSLDKAPPPSAGAPLIKDLRALSPRDQYLGIVGSITATFPALRRLHISFEGSVRRIPVPRPNVTTLFISTLGEVDADELQSLVLGPIDAMPIEIEKQVLLYQSLYTALLAAESEKGEVKEVEHLRSDGRPGWTKFWRPLETTEGGGKAGYWVCKHG